MTLDIATAYKYVNLQMAAEALYDFDATKQNVNLNPGDTSSYLTINPDFLTTGNEHTSKFTTTQAAEFSKEWTVIEHKSDTTTGFSGTLFQNNVTKEFVLSWSLLEAMVTGCRILASDREVIRDGENGELVDFFDVSTSATGF